MAKCPDCRHGDFGEASNVGACYRFPPQLVPVVSPDGYGGFQHEVQSQFPTVYGEQGCGEFARKITKVSASIKDFSCSMIVEGKRCGKTEVCTRVDCDLLPF